MLFWYPNYMRAYPGPFPGIFKHIQSITMLVRSIHVNHGSFFNKLFLSFLNWPTGPIQSISCNIRDMDVWSPLPPVTPKRRAMETSS